MSRRAPLLFQAALTGAAEDAPHRRADCQREEERQRSHRGGAFSTPVGEGDSGGPVLVTAGDMKVRAVGMIQGGPADDARYRTSSPTWGGNSVCTWRFYFTAMRTIVNTLPNASLVTG